MEDYKEVINNINVKLTSVWPVSAGQSLPPFLVFGPVSGSFFVPGCRLKHSPVTAALIYLTWAAFTAFSCEAMSNKADLWPSNASACLYFQWRHEDSFFCQIMKWKTNQVFFFWHMFQTVEIKHKLRLRGSESAWKIRFDHIIVSLLLYKMML